MAENILISSRLRLVLDNGTDPESGDMKKKLKSFNNVTPSATADQLFTVAQAFVSLQTLPLYSVERADNSELVSE